MRKQTVIYTRYSSDMQREDSCEDQKREVILGLRRLGIDVVDPIVIEDKAESGTKSNRTGFQRLTAMIERGEVGILAVDDQSRLSRADNASSFITDLIYSGGRFISPGEGIDTAHEGWHLRVKMTEVHNSTTIREIGRRVQRGQRGRVLDDGAAGDHPFGYETFYIDPNWAETSRRACRPKKGVRLFEAEARWVRQVFDWFVNDSKSISEIARELTRLNVDKGRKSKGSTGWHHSQVRRMLENAKYIGEWRWGVETSIRNSKGKIKQVPVPVEEQVVRDRPHLRIIDQITWDKAQKRLRELKEVYGVKDHQKPRGPKPHHTDIYPTSVLGGLITCAECGSRLWVRGGSNRPSLGCPSYTKGLCGMSTMVSVPKAEEKLFGFVGQIVSSWPSWMETATAALRNTVQEAASRLPESIQRDEEQLARLEREVENLLDQLGGGSSESRAVRRRIEQREAEIETIQQRVKEAKLVQKATIAFPDDQWIKDQFTDLASLLKEDKRQAACLLRRLLHRVEAESVIPRGKLRGFIRLHVEIDFLDLLKETLGGRLPEAILQTSTSESNEGHVKFVLDLGEPTRRDLLAADIAAMRERGLSWREIDRETGLGIGNCHNIWRRWKNAQYWEPSVRL